MSFTFTNAAAIPPRPSPLRDLVGNILSGYSGVVNAKYLPREKEADIFHKQISPLAMLASSPYFSSLHPEQQQQIAGYINQMLSKQGLAGGLGQAQEEAPQQGGLMHSLLSKLHLGSGVGQQQVGIMPQGGSMGSSMGGQETMQGPQEGNNEERLTPRNPAEHFTKTMRQNPLSPGSSFTGNNGDVIYNPTGTQIQEGTNAIIKTKGLDKLFDEYSQILPKIGGAGGFKRDISKISSGIQKTGLPGSEKVASWLGGHELSNEEARSISLRAQIAPQLKALHFTDQEINDMLNYHPGEDEKNIKQRLKNTLPVIKRRVELQRKNLETGINVSKNAPTNNNEDTVNPITSAVIKNINKKANPVTEAESNGPDSNMTLMEDATGNQGYVPSNQVTKLLTIKGMKKV